MYNDKGVSIALIIIAVIVVVVGIVGLLIGAPIYNVWAQEMSGKADLREAEWSKQIAIEEAKAKLESSELQAEADIIRARGIAEANRIISGSITTNYIKYKFIEGLNDGNTEVIYVPTEANIPILEVKQ